MAEWTWEPDDFAALWYSDAHDRIPSPLRYTSRFAFRDDFAAHRAAVWDRYSTDELDEIIAAFRTLGDSDLRIEILGGTCKHKNSTGPDDIREYRILGARDSYRAVVLSQAGNQHEHGPIRARMFPAEQLPARLVNAIPACAPGTEKPATFHPDDLVPRRDTYLQDNARNTPASSTNASSAAPSTAAAPPSSSPPPCTPTPSPPKSSNGTTSPPTAATPNTAPTTSPSAPPPPPT